MDPNFMMSYFFLGNTYSWDSRWKEAISTFQKLATLSGDSPLALGFLGLSYGMDGQKDEAKKILDLLNKRAENKDAFPLFKLIIHIGLGDKSQALEWLEKAYDGKESMLVLIRFWSIFNSLRQEPRFKALLKKMRLE